MIEFCLDGCCHTDVLFIFHLCFLRFLYLSFKADLLFFILFDNYTDFDIEGIGPPVPSTDLQPGTLLAGAVIGD